MAKIGGGAMIVSDTSPPPVGGMGGSIHSWERAPSPWHRDAFPEELADQAPEQGVRRNGWLGLDWCGNAITFVADGTEVER